MVTPAVWRAALAAALPPEVEALLVTDLVNVRYLTGFTGSNAAVLVRRDGGSVFATDGRYITQAAREVPDLDTIDTRTLGPDLVRRAAETSVARLGIEADHVSLSEFARWKKRAAAVALVPLTGVVESLRAVKDEAEIAALRTACSITDAAFGKVLGTLRPGVTERDVAWSLWSTMRADGAEALAFDSIVAFGPHSAVPHHRPTDRALASGDLIKLDFGARYDGYHADMTRTVVSGPAEAWQVELHANVAAVQHSCRGATRPGATTDGLGRLARDEIEAAGYRLVHGLGHGVGMEVHEDPLLTPTSAPLELSAGMCVTVEPGIYLPDRGGVRIEDTVVVTAPGNEPLTKSPRELIEV
jgi:Xaa-Pro aminopeptidase